MGKNAEVSTPEDGGLDLQATRFPPWSGDLPVAVLGSPATARVDNLPTRSIGNPPYSCTSPRSFISHPYPSKEHEEE